MQALYRKIKQYTGQASHGVGGNILHGAMAAGAEILQPLHDQTVNKNKEHRSRALNVLLK